MNRNFYFTISILLCNKIWQYLVKMSWNIFDYTFFNPKNKNSNNLKKTEVVSKYDIPITSVLLDNLKKSWMFSTFDVTKYQLHSISTSLGWGYHFKIKK